jgi:hypothetical protein
MGRIRLSVTQGLRQSFLNMHEKNLSEARLMAQMLLFPDIASGVFGLVTAALVPLTHINVQ